MKDMRSRKTLTLPVTLTGDELKARGSELAQCHEEARLIENRKKVVAATTKGELDELKARSSILATAINKGAEDRSVECVEDLDPIGRVAKTWRTDTWELVSTRGLTREEIQLTFFGPVPTPPGSVVATDANDQAVSLNQPGQPSEEGLPADSGAVSVDQLVKQGEEVNVIVEPSMIKEGNTPDPGAVSLRPGVEPLPDTPEISPGAAVVEMKRGKSKGGQ